MPYTFVTLPFNANSLSFSPYNDSLLAITSSQNFGLVGNGRTHILNISPKGIHPITQYPLTLPPSLPVLMW
jgi:peroxin-7